MATLEDIAKVAHVSKMTVSRAINHPELVRDELKTSIFSAMHELNYRPNVAAKALVNNKTQVIKFFVLEDIDITEPYYMKLLVGIAEYLAKYQYSLQLMTDQHLDIGASDGYIITGMRDEDYDWIKRLELPVVLFGENRWRLDFVDTNNEMGTQMATRYALEQGYDRVVFIGIDVKEPFEYSRENGYIQVMQENQRMPEIHRFANHSHLAMDFIEATWSRITPNTCFICASDRLAFGIQKGILQMSPEIATDYGVIGFDGVFLDQVATPQLTTVEQPMYELGEACAELLLRKIKDNYYPLEERLLQPKLKIGGSTRKK
ncbi:transcriptional regulator [Agrilactobacillus composti DSM 18527 = JCM 14202]|uniref:Transcriptional regulator n=1 Tax=Agrilactobacillus composti DSM 18527 = JCM 14202 TaxID=1423734 RepID=X0PSV1_9LACO|nr:LacI family DNA-binding transcriptional regulator [Agrilactobacillus composti]KRM35481.1 transcriptional regulator [Agrilactobacillus composti DSM 18527 = JCM 14202]GAF41007.1 maltose operon transcriptional repressor MalR, LacI family [Agrilactobacillus composti DSM 18527 = JCM 14202]